MIYTSTKQKIKVVYEGCQMEGSISIIKDDNSRSQEHYARCFGDEVGSSVLQVAIVHGINETTNARPRFSRMILFSRPSQPNAP